MESWAGPGNEEYQYFPHYTCQTTVHVGVQLYPHSQTPPQHYVTEKLWRKPGNEAILFTTV